MAMNRSTIYLLCERGVSYTYYVSCADFQVSVEPIVDNNRKLNGNGIFKDDASR